MVSYNMLSFPSIACIITRKMNHVPRLHISVEHTFLQSFPVAVQTTAGHPKPLARQEPSTHHDEERRDDPAPKPRKVSHLRVGSPVNGGRSAGAAVIFAWHLCTSAGPLLSHHTRSPQAVTAISLRGSAHRSDFL